MTQHQLMFLSSYGDLHAVTLEERWFSTAAMLVGIGLFFGFILGGMASMLTNLDSQRARYIHHLNVIKDHMVCNIKCKAFTNWGGPQLSYLSRKRRPLQDDSWSA